MNKMIIGMKKVLDLFQLRKQPRCQQAMLQKEKMIKINGIN